VRPFPGPGGKWQVSSEGGVEPLWARSGKQLFYRWWDQVWVVDLRLDAGFAATKPRLLFEKPGYVPVDLGGGWDISPNGQRFLMVKLEERKSQPVTEMILVQNWLEELKRLCPTGK
jgi:serine/threonine-protein kinase